MRGDAWRVYIRQGPASLSPQVWDHHNGMYEVVFLVMEPGDYFRPDHPRFYPLWRPSWTACGLVHKRFETKIIFFNYQYFIQAEFKAAYAGEDFLFLLDFITDPKFDFSSGCLNIQKNVLEIVLLQHKKYEIKWLPYKAIARTRGGGWQQGLEPSLHDRPS